MPPKVCRSCQRSLAEEAFRSQRNACIECERAYDRARYASDTEKRRALVDAWKERNPDAQRAYQMRRRARKMQAAGRYTREQLEARMVMFAGRCWICAKIIESGELHYDHVKPIFEGGLDVLSNLAPAHAACNLVKGRRWLGVDRLEELKAQVRARVEELYHSDLVTSPHQTDEEQDGLRRPGPAGEVLGEGVA